jgi:hypothetical protein
MKKNREHGIPSEMQAFHKEPASLRDEMDEPELASGHAKDKRAHIVHAVHGIVIKNT